MDKNKSLITLTTIAIGTLIYNYLRPIKSNVKVIQDFQHDRFIGEWHEIARMNFPWEKNLVDVTLEYLKNEKGTYHIRIGGYHSKSGFHKVEQSKVKTHQNQNIGSFKAALFGRFFSNFNIVEIDPDYQDVLIFGDNLDRMWIFSRKKTLPKETIEVYQKYALDSGYDVSKLIWNHKNF